MRAWLWLALALLRLLGHGLRPGYVETEYRADYQTDVFTVDAAGGKLIWTGITRSVDLSSTQRTTDEISRVLVPGTDQTGHSRQHKLTPSEAWPMRIDALLPQTQCTRCGYDGCRPYAAGARRRAEAAINRCPPGGAHGIGALAALLGREVCRSIRPAAARPTGRGLDRPAACIGCARCLPAMPGGCDHRRPALPAHRARARLHRLRAVHRQLSGGLHRDAATRAPMARAPHAGREPHAATSVTARAMQRARTSARRCWPSANASRHAALATRSQ